MTNKAKHLTLELKQKAVALSYAKANVKQASEDLNIFPPVLYHWRKELKDYGKNSFHCLGKP
jgi:transposase